MTTRIEIDLNVRVRGNGTRAGFEDVQGALAVGQRVEVYEPESGLVGPGRITEIDTERELVFLSVDWGQLHEMQAEASPSCLPNAIEHVSNQPMTGIAARLASFLAGSLIPNRYGHQVGRLEVGPLVTAGGPVNAMNLVVATP